MPEKPIGHKCRIAHCYNGHSWLAMGDIPEIKAPTYAEERNRTCLDGSEWLQPEMKAFMSSKLYESNRQYSKFKKLKIGFKQWCIKRGIKKTKIYKLYKSKRK